MISIQNLHKTFGARTAVRDITLNIKAGEIFGLVGPDGAGKTTLIRMLTGIMAPSAGQFTILGSANPECSKGKLGYVPQKFSLYGDLTVMENIRLLGSLYGQSAAQITAEATRILSFTNLLPFKDRLADHLSGGMKQKLALAAGLMHKPQLYFLDEPTTGVDPVSRREFWQMLYQLNKEGTTIFVSTPYMDEAEFCSRVAFMHDGVITACDSPQRLRQTYPYQLLELSTPTRDLKAQLATCPIIDMNLFGASYHLVVADAAAAIPAITLALQAAAIPIHALRRIPPTLDDVFVALASEVN